MDRALVFFLDGGEIADGTNPPLPSDEAVSSIEKRLHEELKAAQERLSLSLGEHDTAVEDLRAANEELQSINEEYRSTSEELETSKEELQSMNEELQTVNGELKNKLETISSAHSDLENLTMATEIGTLFLDSELKIRMFTPPVADLFNITEQDVGRTITDFTNRLDYEALEQDSSQVLRDLTPIEIEVRSRDDKCYIARIRPYRTIENRIEGVVMTFVDITARIETERRLRESEEKYRTLFDSIDEGFCVIELLYDGDGNAENYCFIDVNAAFERQTGIRDPIGRTMRSFAPQHEDEWYEIYGRIARTGQPERFEHEAAALNRYYEVYAFPVGEPAENRLGVLFNDIGDRKRSQQRLQLMVGELNHRVKNTLAVVDAIARQTFVGFEDHEAFKAFEGRLASLSGAHSLLSTNNWQHTTLHDIAESTRRACGVPRDRIDIDEGAVVHLEPTQGVSLTMALHELMTNALKYGALSDGEGRVILRWEATGEEPSELRIVWREEGGPPVEPPSREGFGTMMIREALSSPLGGSVVLEYPREGFRCFITAPLPKGGGGFDE